MTDKDTSAEAVESACRDIHDAVNRNKLPAYRLVWVDLFRALYKERDAYKARAERAEGALKKLWRRQDSLETFDAVVNKIVADTLARLEAYTKDSTQENSRGFDEYGNYGENNGPVGNSMSGPGDKDYEV